MDEHLATVYDAILDGDVMGATDGVQAPWRLTCNLRGR